jgi:hypothetical protein
MTNRLVRQLFLYGAVWATFTWLAPLEVRAQGDSFDAVWAVMFNPRIQMGCGGCHINPARGQGSWWGFDRDSVLASLESGVSPDGLRFTSTPYVTGGRNGLLASVLTSGRMPQDGARWQADQLAALNTWLYQYELPVIQSGDVIPGTIWKVFFNSPVAVRFDASNTTNQTAGTFRITSTVATTDPVTLTFQQYLPADVTSDPPSGGFRLNLQLTVRNRTGSTWGGYDLSLADDYPAPDNPPGGVYVPQPHFHPSTYAPDQPMAFTSFNQFVGLFMGDPSSVDPADEIALFDGTLGAGANLGITNLLLHERQFTPDDLGGDTGLRVFRLFLTPLSP